MEFVTLALMTWSAYLLLKHPERERLAFRLLLASLALMAFTFLVGARGYLVPGVNL
jgi:hypothetical protein